MSIFLPQVTIQHDFQTVIAEVQEGIIPEEPFWVSCYKAEHDSVHGKVNVRRSDGGRVDTTSDLSGVEFRREEHSMYFAGCPKLSIPPTRLRVARQVIGDTGKLLPPITAFDVAPDTSLCATGDGDGNLNIFSPSSYSQNLTSKPHLSTILSLRFFPSSKVILTSSNDFTLSVISAENLSIPRTFKAHSRAVTDSAIISRGKNVLSCAKDGTLRLWDVGSGIQIRSMGSKNYSPVYKMSLGDRTSETMIYRPPDGEFTEVTQASPDPREVDTAGKVIFSALHNGSFEAFDLDSKSSFFCSDLPSNPSPLESIAYSAADNLLATGSRTGIVTIYDTRQLAAALFSFQRNGASVEDITFLSAQGEVRLAVATTDGLPYVASVRPEGPQVVEELVGYDCDAVRSIRAVAGNLWTAGDDGSIRRY